MDVISLINKMLVRTANSGDLDQSAPFWEQSGLGTMPALFRPFLLEVAGLFLFKINFFEKKFRNSIEIANSLDPDQTVCWTWSGY